MCPAGPTSVDFCRLLSSICELLSQTTCFLPICTYSGQLLKAFSIYFDPCRKMYLQFIPRIGKISQKAPGRRAPGASARNHSELSPAVNLHRSQVFGGHISAGPGAPPCRVESKCRQAPIRKQRTDIKLARMPGTPGFGASFCIIYGRSGLLSHSRSAIAVYIKHVGGMWQFVNHGLHEV